MEGEFAKRPNEKWRTGERFGIIKRDDNLYMEGNFVTKSKDKWMPGERSNVVKHADNTYLMEVLVTAMCMEIVASLPLEMVHAEENVEGIIRELLGSLTI